MGTVNYFTSDYITLGLKPYEVYAQDCYECDLENVENILSKYSFHYYYVKIEFGYYEGFSLRIENNFPIVFECYEDKCDAQKELTQLKKCLLECAKYGMVECYPGWCTGYEDYKTTCKDIKAVIKTMRGEVKSTPTWMQYERSSD